MKLIFIHGRGQQGLNEAILKEQWEASFDRGLTTAGLARPADLSIDFPYYGDRLHELEEQLKTPADVISRGTDDDAALKEAEFQLELAREIAAKMGIDLKDAPIDEPFLERGLLNLKSVLAALRFLDKRTGSGEYSIRRFTHDVHVYLNIWGIRTQIDDFIRQSLNNPGPIVVVAHSLGSIIAYNVLRNLQISGGAKLVTLGSPLGIGAIRERLEPPIQNPACLNGWWFNARDMSDFVSLYPLTGEYFDVTPLVRDYSEVKNFTNNHHGIAGYLEDPVVAIEIFNAVS